MQKAQNTKQKEKKTEDTAKQDDLQDKLTRALADYDNLLKRQERERADVYIRSARGILEDLLPVVDDLERAQAHLQDQGLKMALDHFYKILGNYGVVEISAQIGDNFDSLIHEAIDSIEGGSPNTIAQIFTKGYKWKDGKVIRPARVQVYKGTSDR